MLLSQYLKIFPHPEKEGCRLLYSTKKAALVLLPAEVVNKLSRGVFPVEHADKLIKLGILVPDHQKEKAEVFDYLQEVNRHNTGLDIAVILGLDCNFACTYCYEGSMKGKHTMSQDTAEQVVAFIQKHYVPGKKRMVLDFYGGEPLLYTEQIKYIAKHLKSFVEQRNGAFRFSLVTNGSLLTRKRVEELVPLGLSGAKITVDGPAAIHNQCRPFKSGRPSFDAIMQNVQDCHKIVKIGLGGNFTSENYQDFPALLDYMEELGLIPRDLGMVQFAPVLQTTDQYVNPEFTGGCLSSSEPWVAEATLMLREEVLKRGYKTPKLGPSPCMVDINDSLVVHFDGRIFKCVAMIGHDEFAVGDVWNGIRNYAETYHTKHWKHNDACRECVYLPMCFGGCRNMELQRSGSMAKVDCWREFYDAILEETIKQDVIYRYQNA